MRVHGGRKAYFAKCFRVIGTAYKEQRPRIHLEQML